MGILSKLIGRIADFFMTNPPLQKAIVYFSFLFLIVGSFWVIKQAFDLPERVLAVFCLTNIAVLSINVGMCILWPNIRKHLVKANAVVLISDALALICLGVWWLVQPSI